MARTFRSATGPDERLTIDQSVRMALPAQRVAFVLHYVLKYPQLWRGYANGHRLPFAFRPASAENDLHGFRLKVFEISAVQRLDHDERKR